MFTLAGANIIRLSQGAVSMNITDYTEELSFNNLVFLLSIEFGWIQHGRKANSVSDMLKLNWGLGL